MMILIWSLAKVCLQTFGLLQLQHPAKICNQIVSMQSCCRLEAIGWIKKWANWWLEAIQTPSMKWSIDNYKFVFYKLLIIPNSFQPKNIYLRKTNLQGFLTDACCIKEPTNCISFSMYQPHVPSLSVRAANVLRLPFECLGRKRNVFFQWKGLGDRGGCPSGFFGLFALAFENGRIDDGWLCMIAFSWLKVVIHCDYSRL